MCGGLEPWPTNSKDEIVPILNSAQQTLIEGDYKSPLGTDFSLAYPCRADDMAEVLFSPSQGSIE